MNGSRTFWMFALSILAGLAAVVLAARWLAQQGHAGIGEWRVVAARDLDLGQPVHAGVLELVPWPGAAIPRGSFGRMADLEGRVLLASVTQGEPILESRLAPVGTRGGLSAVIAEGKRAITVRVNEVVGVAGFALPGNFVDVMVSTQDDASRMVSKIVLERILVLAVAQEASRDDTKPRVVNAVTLEVTPAQAEQLDLARSVGTLSLALRNQMDREPAATPGVRKSELLAGSSAVPAAAATVPPQVRAAPARRQASVRTATPVAAPAPVVPAATVPAPLSPAASEPLPAPATTIEVIRGLDRSVRSL